MRMTMKNKRGLSAVVATLIIILLVLVAVGILWAVISNVIDEGAQTIEYGQLCNEVSFDKKTVEAVDGESGNYTVRLSRNPGGEEVDGVKIVLRNETTSSGTIVFVENFKELGDKSRIVDTGSEGENLVLNATELVYVPYFEDDAGEEHLCTQDVQEFVS